VSQVCAEGEYTYVFYSSYYMHDLTLFTPMQRVIGLVREKATATTVGHLLLTALSSSCPSMVHSFCDTCVEEKKHEDSIQNHEGNASSTAMSEETGAALSHISHMSDASPKTTHTPSTVNKHGAALDEPPTSTKKKGVASFMCAT